MKKKPNGKPRLAFVMLTWDMLNSKAYRELPASAAKVLPYFLGKVKDKEHRHPDDPGHYKIEFPFSYGEAKRLGFGKSTFYKMLIHLVRFGFIDVACKGYTSREGTKVTSSFVLSKRWENFGTHLFRDGDLKKYFPDIPRVPKVNQISPKSEPVERQRRSIESK